MSPQTSGTPSVEPPAERHRAPTLIDIAKAAGVSKSTVSRVLNQSPGVSARSRSRTLQAVERLGYRTNIAARSLRTAKTAQVGLLVPAINNETFGEIAEQLDTSLASANISLAISSSGWNTDSELRALDAFESRGVDAMVVALSDERDPGVVARLNGFHPPIVLLDRRVRGLNADAVLTDHRVGLEQCLAHLASLGHTRVAITAATDRTLPGREQIASYRAAVKRHHLAVDDRLMFRTDDYHHDNGRAAAALILEAKATAVVVCGPVAFVAGLLHLFADESVSIPGDISVVEYTDSELASIYNPRLSVILRDVAEVGRIAGRLVLRRMANSDEPMRVESVSTQFLDRQSVGRPKVRRSR